MHYVIGDTHGCFDEMMKLIEKIERKDEEAIFYFVGDFVDRGYQVPAIINWVMNNITTNGKYQTVLGNHEDMLIYWFDKDVIQWDRKQKILKRKIELPETNFDFSYLCKQMGWDTIEKIKPMIDFFRTYPLYKDVEIKTKSGNIINYKIVHAWYDFDEENPLKQRYNMLWERNFGEGNYQNDTIIVHGHTPTMHDEYIWCNKDTVHPGMIDYQKNEINVDGGCVFGTRYSEYYYQYPCMLGAICLETLEEIYPYDIEERFAEIFPKRKNLLSTNIKRYKQNYLCNENPFRKEMLDRINDKK